jgi:hypothetical protein
LGFFGLFKFKIGLEAFKSWALIMVLIFLIDDILLHKSKNIFWGPIGPDRLDFQAHLALPNFQAHQAWAWGLI